MGKTDKTFLQHKYLNFAKRKGNGGRENRIKSESDSGLQVT